MALRDGGSLYLEFSTGRAARRHEGQLRAPVATDVVVAELEERGAVIVHREETQVGDRSVARLVAQWQT